MRLYLSSYGIGDRPDELLRLLRGGVRAALIANSADAKAPQERTEAVERELADLRGLGLDAVELDLRDYFGRADALRQRLAQVDLVWTRGGSAFILRRAFRQSGADELVPELLAADAFVYAGYSAGPAMLAQSLDGIECVDDPHLVPHGYDPEVLYDCLGLLPYEFVPHYRSDHPESAAVEGLIQYLIDRHRPFVALRDGEALVHEGDRTEIVS
jgi:dipeptidase E